MSAELSSRFGPGTLSIYFQRNKVTDLGAHTFATNLIATPSFSGLPSFICAIMTPTLLSLAPELVYGIAERVRMIYYCLYVVKMEIQTCRRPIERTFSDFV